MCVTMRYTRNMQLKFRNVALKAVKIIDLKKIICLFHFRYKVSALLLIGVICTHSSLSYGLDANQKETPPSMMEAFQMGRDALRAGNYDEASATLEYAASKGHLLARWKLASMYAKGHGVVQDHGRAFTYFTAIADEYAEIAPNARLAPIVSDAFYRSGHYFLKGIEKSNISPQPERAISMLTYASSYFRNDKAQFLLGKIYAEGHDKLPANLHLAMRWLKMSCRNQNANAQLYLGELLLRDPQFTRHKREGLVWINMAKHSLGAQHPDVIRAMAIAKAELPNAFLQQPQDQKVGIQKK